MRNWKSLSTSFATLVARLSATASMLITTAVASRRMTTDELGLWLTLLAVNILTNALDMGFQFTLGNRLAALGSRGAESEEERRETFISILLLQVVIYLIDVLLVLILFPLIPWAHWFKITDSVLAVHVTHLMPIAVIVMMGTLPVGLIWTVFFAYHEITLASFLSLLATALQTVIFVAAAYSMDLRVLHAFSAIVIIYFSSNLLIGAILTVYVFIHRKWRFAIPPIARMSAIIRSLSRVSFHAFFLTLTGNIQQVLGTLFAGHVAGLAVTADFTLVQKLFSFLVSAHLSLLAPIAPFVSRESHAGNWDAVRRRLRICVLQVWPPVFLLLGAGVWYFHPLLIRLWSGRDIQMYPLAAILLAGAALTGFVNTFSVFLNSLGLVKVQAALAVVMLAPSVILPALLGKYCGVAGIAWSALICSIPFAIAWPIYTRRSLRLRLLRV